MPRQRPAQFGSVAACRRATIIHALAGVRECTQRAGGWGAELPSRPIDKENAREPRRKQQ